MRCEPETPGLNVIRNTTERDEGKLWELIAG